MAEFVELARGYREAPSDKFFTLPKEYPCSRDDLCALLASRGTSLYAVTFTTPPFIEEIVVPQLKKSTQAILSCFRGTVLLSIMPTTGWKKSGACCCLNYSSMIFLPSGARRPPSLNRANADKFREKYQNLSLPGPFIENGRYVAEVSREFIRAADLLSSPALLDVGTGRDIRAELGKDWCVLEGADCWQEEFASL